jgi:Transglycosylase SLT domain
MATRPEPTGGKPGKPKPKPKPATEKQKFIWAEGQQESGGNYSAVNSSSGALGRWQVMPANLPGWAKQAGLAVITPSEYLADPNYQDKLVWAILGGDYDTYGAAGAAAVWYSGQDDPTATYGNPPVYQYVNDVLALMRQAPSTLAGTGSTPVTRLGPVAQNVFPDVPKPGTENWSSSIVLTSQALSKGTKALTAHAKTVQSLTIRR